MSDLPSLAGRTVVVTRPRGQARSLGDGLRALGSSVLYLPTVAIAEPALYTELDDAVARFTRGFYSWALFTSTNAVDRFFERIPDDRLSALPETKVAAVGSSTRRALEGRGINVDLVPEEYTGEALAERIERGSGHVLLPRAAGAPDALPRRLEAHGWTVDEVIAYRIVAGEPDPEIVARVRAGVFDAVTFTSGSAARNFVSLVAEPAELGLGAGGEPRRMVVCIGPKAATVAQSLGFRVDAVAEPHTVPALIGTVSALLVQV